MAQTAQIQGAFNTNAAYAASFGPTPDQTLYSDPNNGIDARPGFKSMFGKNVTELKAMDTQAGGAGTAGYGLIPVYVDPMIVDTTRKWTPLVEIVPRRSNMGMTADFNTITAKGGGFTANEDSALAEQDDTYDRSSKGIKFLYAVGRVTGPAQAAVPSYMLGGFNPTGQTGPFSDSGAPNAMQLEVLVKTRSIRELEENLIVNGDSSTDATEFDGFIQQISTTNKVDKNTSAVSLDDINTAVQYAFDDGGRPNLAVSSSAVYTDLLNLLSNKIGYLQATSQVFWGFSTIVLHTMVGDIPVVPSMYMSNTSGSKAIYFLDMSVIEMRVLQDLSFERLAKTNDSEKFMLKIYETLIVRAPAFCSWIGEIA